MENVIEGNKDGTRVRREGDLETYEERETREYP